MSIIPKFIFSRRYEGIYCKITILGICITTKLKHIPKKNIELDIENEFKIIRNDNYVEKNKNVGILLSFGIGDYLLFRPFLQYIRNYYEDYNITLIVAIHSGNYKDIIMHFDIQNVDEIILFNFFTENLDKKLNLFFADKKYNILISHFYGRGYGFNFLAEKINAMTKICSYGSLWHTSKFDREYTLSLYNKVIRNNVDEDEVTHELDINKNFFEQLFNLEIDINSFNILLKEDFFNKINFDFNNKYCIIFPYASIPLKYYDIKKYSSICKYLFDKYNIISYIVGSENNFNITNDFINDSNSHYIKNICGKYKLDELFYIFNKAKLIITVDSAGYHMGVFTNSNVICISNGMTYHRYLLYNDNFVHTKNINIILPKILENDIKSNSINKIGFEYYPMYDVNTITPDEICDLIDRKYSL